MREYRFKNRTLYAGYFKREGLLLCSPSARYCYFGLISLADREGRLWCRLRALKGMLFPGDSIEIEKLLEELIDNREIIVFETAVGKAIQIVNFTTDQIIGHTEMSYGIVAPDNYVPAFRPKKFREPKVIEPVLRGQIPLKEKLFETEDIAKPVKLNINPNLKKYGVIIQTTPEKWQKLIDLYSKDLLDQEMNDMDDWIQTERDGRQYRAFDCDHYEFIKKWLKYATLKIIKQPDVQKELKQLSRIK